ncbi:hypothetical protein M426DRAFT_10937 [Hypoxylon sp. CI-4A]|nr:hypothetical protein M426DRAFT_10937 [Hypoxylon sp. CI-4A]
MSPRLGGRSAWWPQGPALEEFEKEIQPGIEDVLKSLDLSYTDIFIKLYMIGRNPEKANPVIMICCLNRKTRTDAEDNIRASGLLKKHQGFGLGAAALPLENSAPLRRLGQTMSVHKPQEYTFKHPPGSVMIDSWMTKLGQRLYFERPAIGPLPYSTGGVLLEASGTYFQLTVGHVTNPVESSNPADTSLTDLDDCYFDVALDDGDDEDDDDAGLAATSRGSKTPENDSDSVVLSDQTADIFSDICEEPDNSIPDAITHPEAILAPSPFGLGQLDFTNYVEYKHIGGSRTIYVHNIARSCSQGQNVVVVTSSKGPIWGTLIPGPISCRPRRELNIQKVFQVWLSSTVVEGDCGSAVIDSQTGDLYGHLVFGGGSPIAYFVSASEIFQDISKRGMVPPPKLPLGERRYDVAGFLSAQGQNPSTALEQSPRLKAPLDKSDSTLKPRASSRGEIDMYRGEAAADDLGWQASTFYD